jgi:hypothetical protein
VSLITVQSSTFVRIALSFLCVVEKAARVLRGQAPLSCVDPEVLSASRLLQ